MSTHFAWIWFTALIAFDSCATHQGIEGKISPPSSFPLVDLSEDTSRQTIVDREAGVYLGHPTTALLDDSTTIVTVYPRGHGRGPIIMKRSTDGGKSWSERLPTPPSWETSLETPTIYLVGVPGERRLLLFSGLYPIRMSTALAERVIPGIVGQPWSELSPIGDFGGIVAMSALERLNDGRLMAIFHDDGRFIRARGGLESPPSFTTYKTISRDNGITWSAPDPILSRSDLQFCEAGLLRSPNRKQIALLLRENSRRRNSHAIFSDDEGEHWSLPRELPWMLTGDRHTARYARDGRIVVTFRDMAAESPTRGDWVAWVGRYEDIVAGTPGICRIRFMDNQEGTDCAYPGLELLPDGTFVTVTYGHWARGEEPYIVAVRFRIDEIDRLLGVPGN